MIHRDSRFIARGDTRLNVHLILSITKRLMIKKLNIKDKSYLKY